MFGLLVAENRTKNESLLSIRHQVVFISLVPIQIPGLLLLVEQPKENPAGMFQDHPGPSILSDDDKQILTLFKIKNWSQLLICQC